VTTFTTLREEPPQTFSSAAEAERHFNQKYLPGLVRSVSEVTIDGPASRRLHDRVLNKVIENEWTSETKSPSPMMQELAGGFRKGGFPFFRHGGGFFLSSWFFRSPF